MSERSYSDEYFSVVNALSMNYDSAYMVDFDIDEVTPFKINKVVDQQSGSYFRSRPKYWDAMSLYIGINTAPEDRDEMRRVASVENLRKELADKDLFIYDYRVLRDGEIQYYRMKVVNVSDEAGLHKAVMGFANINSQKIQDIQRYAYYSDVTGGSNYNSFKEKMKKCTDSGFIAAMDIYAFKIVNSTCGVKRGDEALRASWECVVRCLGKNDHAAHINADHFAIFFADMDKTVVNGKLLDITFGLQRMSKDMEIPLLSPYFGVAEWKPGDTEEEIYGNATFAKHTIKGNTSTNFAYFSPQDSEKALEYKQMGDAFDDALENGEFEIWYQPKYDPENVMLIGAEALVRWRRNGSLVSPGVFIPIFEKNGMIRRLDEYVFKNVCLQQKKWRDEGRRIIPISVNISRVSLYFQNVVEQYRCILKETGMSADLIPLEITESAAVANADIKALTDRFFNSGFALHMDDFGTGYSSLSTLNQMHFNTLKLDKSIIDYIGNYGGDKLLEHTIALAKDLGLHVTAEGVENETQVKFLKCLHCDSIQGFFFSKPLPLDEFESRLDHGRLNESDLRGDIPVASVSSTANTGEIVKEVFEAAAEYTKSQGRHFSSNVPVMNSNVYCSGERAVLALGNIIEFACDHVPEGGSVTVTCSEDMDEVDNLVLCRFTVTGISAHISNNDLVSILRKDGRVELAKEIIRNASGSVKASTIEENDICFTVRIAFKPVEYT